MKLVKQLFVPKKMDWVVFFKYNNRQPSPFFYSTLKAAKTGASKWSNPGEKVQIYRLSYELKEAFAVPEKKAKKGAK